MEQRTDGRMDIRTDRSGLGSCLQPRHSSSPSGSQWNECLSLWALSPAQSLQPFLLPSSCSLFSDSPCKLLLHGVPPHFRSRTHSSRDRHEEANASNRANEGRRATRMREGEKKAAEGTRDGYYRIPTGIRLLYLIAGFIVGKTYSVFFCHSSGRYDP